MKKKAFTLAEILVTLLIIGVIAAIIVPATKDTADEKEAYAKLTKAQTTLANITAQLEAEHGPIRFWTWPTKSGEGEDATIENPFLVINDYYVPKMNIRKLCGTDATKGCFTQWNEEAGTGYRIKKITGEANNKFGDGTWYTFITSDGLYWAASEPLTPYSEGNPEYIKNAYAYFEVDINGEKEPNTIGYDVFGFQLRADGLYPFGGCPNGECSTSGCKEKTGTGWQCTAEFLNTGKYEW